MLKIVQQAQMEQKYELNPPKYLLDFTVYCICPINLEIMDAPLTVANCGHTFEEQSIKLWLEKQSECPVCRAKLNKKQPGTINPNLVEAIRILRLLLKVPSTLVPQYKPFIVFVKDDKSYECYMIQVYLQDIVATILVKLSIKSQKMAQFLQNGSKVLVYKEKILKTNLLIQDYNIQPFALITYKSTLKR